MDGWRIFRHAVLSMHRRTKSQKFYTNLGGMDSKEEKPPPSRIGGVLLFTIMDAPFPPIFPKKMLTQYLEIGPPIIRGWGGGALRTLDAPWSGTCLLGSWHPPPPLAMLLSSCARTWEFTEKAVFCSFKRCFSLSSPVIPSNSSRGIIPQAIPSEATVRDLRIAKLRPFPRSCCFQHTLFFSGAFLEPSR